MFFRSSFEGRFFCGRQVVVASDRQANTYQAGHAIILRNGLQEEDAVGPWQSVAGGASYRCRSSKIGRPATENLCRSQKTSQASPKTGTCGITVVNLRRFSQQPATILALNCIVTPRHPQRNALLPALRCLPHRPPPSYSLPAPITIVNLQRFSH